MSRGGRPQVNVSKNEFQKCSIINDCQKQIFTYFTQIGLPKGIIFKDKERFQLMGQKKKTIEWSENPQWNPEQERNKISSVLQKKFNQESMVGKLNLDEMKNLLFQISSILPGEATNQIYLILREILVSISLNREIDDIRFDKMYKKLTILNRKFAKKIIKHSIQGKPNDQFVKQSLKKLVQKLRTLIQALCTDPGHWLKYCEIQEEDQKQLMKIYSGES